MKAVEEIDAQLHKFFKQLSEKGLDKTVRYLKKHIVLQQIICLKTAFS